MDTGLGLEDAQAVATTVGVSTQLFILYGDIVD